MHNKISDSGINNIMQTFTVLNRKTKFSVYYIYCSAARLTFSFTMAKHSNVKKKDISWSIYDFYQNKDQFKEVAYLLRFKAKQENCSNRKATLRQTEQLV